MPTKRSAPTDNVQPPAPQRSAPGNDFHLPLSSAGHHNDMPNDAAVASASPPSQDARQNDQLSPTSSHVQLAHAPPATNNSASIDLAPTIEENIHGRQPAIAVETASALHPSIAGNGGARANYHAAQQQRVVTCNLSLIPPSKCNKSPTAAPLITAPDAQQKIRLSGIVLVLYTPQPGPPARMYMLVGDNAGVAGVTVWGDTVSQLTSEPDIIGRAVSIPGCTMSFYNGKRSLNVSRNHVIHFPDNSPHAEWWTSKLQAPSLTTQELLALPDNSIANVLAVCAGIRREEKTACKNCNASYDT
jgi:hypothetical protein